MFDLRLLRNRSFVGALIVSFISEHKQQFGAGPICRVLTRHGCPIASTRISRRPSVS